MCHYKGSFSFLFLFFLLFFVIVSFLLHFSCMWYQTRFSFLLNSNMVYVYCSLSSLLKEVKGDICRVVTSNATVKNMWVAGRIKDVMPAVCVYAGRGNGNRGNQRPAVCTQVFKAENATTWGNLENAKVLSSNRPGYRTVWMSWFGLRHFFKQHFVSLWIFHWTSARDGTFYPPSWALFACLQLLHSSPDIFICGDWN